MQGGSHISNYKAKFFYDIIKIMIIIKFLFVLLLGFSSLFVQMSNSYDDYKDSIYLVCDYDSVNEVENEIDLKILSDNKNPLEYFFYNHYSLKVFIKNQKLFSFKLLKPPRT